jgi:hypothetical protein
MDATALPEKSVARSQRVLECAISNKSVASRYVLMMDEGRTARVCSTYESKQRPMAETRTRTEAAKVLRVRMAGEVAQIISAAS